VSSAAHAVRVFALARCISRAPLFMATPVAEHLVCLRYVR
jgi:hypothetical protein